jgi:mutator protein MutT
MSTEGRRRRHRQTEFSAGAVVVNGDETIVIVPNRRGAKGERVLGLPKGHVEKGETPAQAAAREVHEEAGVEGELVESLGEVRYMYERGGALIDKRVEFFLIEYRVGDPADHDHEIEEARWVPLAEAAKQLTYKGEREMVERAMSRRSDV